MKSTTPIMLSIYLGLGGGCALSLMSCGEDTKRDKSDKDNEDNEDGKDANQAEAVNAESLTTLLEMPADGFTPQGPPAVYGDNVGTLHLDQTRGETPIQVQVTIQECELAFMCPDFGDGSEHATLADVWTSRRDQLIGGTLNQGLQSDPEMIFEHQTVTISGLPAAETYAQAFMSTTTKHGTGTSHVHLSRVIFHDGTNLIQVEAKSKGSFPRSRDEMVSIVTHEELQAAAEAAFAVYAPELFQRSTDE